MKINKRACRKYADLNKKMNTNSGLLIFKQIKYIIRTSIKNVAGQRLLILYFYVRENAANGIFTPEYTLFQSKEDYIILKQCDNGKTKWLISRLDYINNGKEFDYTNCAFYTSNDEKRVLNFCGTNESNGYLAIKQLQTSIFYKKCNLRKKKKEQKIIKRMNGISPLPQKFRNWAQHEILPSYVFYNYKKNRKKQEGYCTACKNKFIANKARHKKAGICPACGRKITYYAIGKGINFSDRNTVQIIQRIGDEFILRICKIFMSYRDYLNPEFSMIENARIFFSYKNNRLMKEAYYYFYNSGIYTNWRKGYRPVINKYYYNFEADVCGHLFTPNLKNVLNNTPWQYCQIGTFYLSSKEPLECMPYLASYLRYPFIEYLVKLKLFNLTSDIVYRNNYITAINLNGKNAHEILKIERNILPILQKTNVRERTLCLVQNLYDNKIRFDEQILLWFQNNEMTDIKCVLFCLKYMNEKKLIKYINEQYEKLGQPVSKYNRYYNKSSVLNEYQDYLQLCKKLDYSLSNTFNLFPRNLMIAHDAASTMFNKRKKQIYNRKIKDNFDSLYKKYNFSKFGMTIIPPKTSDEIVFEGQALHHCVASYVSKVAEDESIILFLRRTQNQNEPWYTIEIKNNNEITQIRGFKNESPTHEIEKFINEWKIKKLIPLAATNKAA